MKRTSHFSGIQTGRAIDRVRGFKQKLVYQLCFLVALHVCFCNHVVLTGAPTDRNAGKTPTAAFLDIDTSSLGSLLETKLLESKRATWLERNEFDKLVRERELEMLLGPQQTDERAALGSLLKADVLVLLRVVQGEKQTRAKLVVCETRRGLRLQVHEMPVGEDLSADADRLAKIVARGFDKYQEEIKEICGVAPFVSHDLTYKHDHLKTAYAKLIDQWLLDQPGLLVVELAEAEAIAKEAGLAGRDIKRQYPLYLLGDYRNNGRGDERKVTIRLRIMRGERELGKRIQRDLPPSDAIEFLRQGAGQLVEAAIGQAARFPNAKVEAEQLAGEVRRFMRLGHWQEAMDIIEASLLLDPRQDELRHDAVVVSGELAKTTGNSIHPVDSYRQYVRAYLRGLHHLEVFLQAARDLSKYRETGQTNFLARFIHLSGLLIPHQSSSPEVKAIATAAQPQVIETALRIARVQVKFRGDIEYAMLVLANRHLSKKKQFDVLLDFVVEHQYLTDVKRRTIRYANGGVTPFLRLDCAEGREFLNQLASQENKQLQAAAKELHIGMLAAIERRAKKRPAPTAIPDVAGPQEIEFRRVKLAERLSDGSTTPLKYLGGGLIPIEREVDVLWHLSGKLFLMKTKGIVEKAWESRHGPFHIRNVCYDGRFVWFTGTLYRKPPELWVLDPDTGRSWQITADDGLPVESHEEANRYQRLAVTQLGSGRVCVAGAFGRTWLAIVTFDPKDGASVNVFHEAREAANRENKQQWQSTNVSFQPIYMCTIEGKADSTGSIPRRILLGRNSENIDVRYHPLLIDAENRSVDVVSDRLHVTLDAYDEFEGAFYNVKPVGTDGALTLLRFGFPELRLVPVMNDVREGWLRFFQGRVNVLGYQWWGGRGMDEPGRVLAAKVPWHYRPRYSASAKHVDSSKIPLVQPPGVGRLVVAGRSNHYGLLIALTTTTGVYSYYQPVFKESAGSP